MDIERLGILGVLGYWVSWDTVCQLGAGIEWLCAACCFPNLVIMNICQQSPSSNTVIPKSYEQQVAPKGKQA